MRNRIILALTTALAGCNFAPQYRQPPSPIYSAYPAVPADLPQTPGAPAGGLSAPETSWQSYFGDEQLKAYLTAALANNRDLEVATARIAQARAQYRIQDAQKLPTVGVQGSATRSRIPLNATSIGDVLDPGEGSGEPRSITFNQYTAQVGVSSFELDFWGKIRNMSESARRQYLATVEARRAFELSLIGQVASSYFTIRSGEDGIALAIRTLAARKEGMAIAKDRMDAGVTSSSDYDQSELLVTQAETELADLRRTTEQQRNQLLELIGGPMTATLPANLPITDMKQVAVLDAGLPSTLLLVRPDIRQAENMLRAADADIGAARGAMFPTISLTAAFGYASSALSSLFAPGTQRWSYGGNVALPIFDGGRSKAGLDQTKAARTEAVASYQKAVQGAFHEVSDALVSRQRYYEQIQAQARAVDAQRRLAETAHLRYDNGVSIYLEVLDAERNLFAAEQQLLKLRAASLQANVALYVSLGGGTEVTKSPSVADAK